MAIKQNKLLAAGAVVVVLGLAWWGAGRYASSKAEQKLTAVLDKAGQRDMVHWASISASPFGSATLKEVSIGPQGQPMAVMERVDISGLRTDPDHQSGDVSIHGLALPNGFSPLGTFELIQNGGKTDLPPSDVSLNWDYQRGDDHAAVHVSLQQPQALNAELELQLGAVNGVAALADNPAIMAAGLLGMGNAMAPLAAIRIEQGKLTIKDDGYVKRSIALYKRYNIPVVPGEGSADKQRDKGFDQRMTQMRQECKKEQRLKGATDNDDACDAVIRFMSGDDDTFKIETKPEGGVSLQQVFRAGMGNYQALLGSFAPTLSN